MKLNLIHPTVPVFVHVYFVHLFPARGWKFGIRLDTGSGFGAETQSTLGGMAVVA